MNTKPAFEIGMTAFGVIKEIVRYNSEIISVQFVFYVPAKYLPPSDDSMFRHNPPRASLAVPRESLLQMPYGKAANMFSLRQHEHAAFSSRVNLQNGKDGYIPLMDFSSKIIEGLNNAEVEALEEIKKFLRHIGQSKGAILNSGRSYHFYGATPFTKNEWLQFLGFCILFKDTKGLYVADRRYIGHMLVDGCTILRISTSEIHPHMPSVAAVL